MTSDSPCWRDRIFGHTFAFIDEEDLQTALFTLDGGVFASAPELSGVLFFEETGGEYSFRYFPNLAARFLMPLKVG